MATVVSEPKKKGDLSLLHFIIVVLLMTCFGLLPPFGSITPVGMKVLGIFLGLLYGWSTCGMLWPSLLGLVALGFSGVGSVKDILIMGFGNETIIFLIFILVIVQMLIDSGAITGISNFILSRKILQGRPWLFSFVFLCVAGLLSCLGQAFAAFFLCWGILYDLFAKMGYKPYEPYPTMMIIGTIYASSPFVQMIPFKAMPMVVLSTFNSMSGVEVNYLRYMIVMIPLGLLMLAGYLLACRLIIRPDLGRLKNLDIDKLIENKEPLTKHQKVTLIAFALVLLALLIPGSLPKSFFLVQFLNQFGIAGLMILATVLMSVIKVDGKPIMNFTKSAATGMNWSVVLLLIAILLMSSLLLGDATGLKPFLLETLSPLLTGHSPLVLMIVMYLLALILTNFMNNMVVAIMFLPVLTTFAASVGANPTVGVIMILLATNTAFLTPAASPATAMLYAKTDWLRTKDVFLHGIIVIAVFIFITLCIGMPVLNFVF